MRSELIYDTRYTEGFVSPDDKKKILPEIEKAHGFLKERNGLGKEFLDWLDLPQSIDETLINEINETAGKLNDISDVIVIIGIGGSYLGARALIEALTGKKDREKIYFAGHNLSGRYLEEFLAYLRDKDVSVNVISKSGTTTEPAIFFRVIEDFMRKKYGAGKIKERIVCTTDREKGALREIADKRGYKRFVIPGGVGGRFSVLSPVGLLPAACAGIKIKDLLEGARKQYRITGTCNIDENYSYKYAAIRNILYKKGKKIEIFSSFDYRMHYISEWWKQLFGESEGKDSRGIFPAACDFSTDLHSMGQMIQEGERNIFETFVFPVNDNSKSLIPESEDNLDNLNYLSGKQINHVNRQAYEATSEAHFEGGVPNSTIFIPEISAFNVGQLFYFFEKAVAISAYMMGVNPFNQPGVEAYKNKMFKLLGKPNP